MSESIHGSRRALEAAIPTAEGRDDRAQPHSSPDQPSPGGQEAVALACALQRLMTLHEGWAGVTEAAMCGPPAIPALTALLARPDPSGLFELRRRAVAALAALGASDVLMGFLAGHHELSDPVARAGEDAVVSTAARTLGLMGERRALPLIVRMAMRRPLPGMIDALGHFRDMQTIPALIRGLDEDDCRASAEGALLRLGPRSRDALLRAAGIFAHDGRPEPRARRSAMKLLVEVGIEPGQRSAVRRFIWDVDAEVSLHAAQAYLRSGQIEGREEILQRLLKLMPHLQWINRGVGEDLLKTYSTVDQSESTAARESTRPAVIG